jgi:transcriptional regulator GlxA family with amidase domain
VADLTFYRGDIANAGIAVLRVTVLLLDGGHASTAIAPLEVFRSAGVLWPLLRGEAAQPRFQVESASLDGRPVRCDGALGIAADRKLRDVRRSDLIVVPSVGLDYEQALRRFARVVPWLRRRYAGGAELAAICSGVALLAETGLLDGRPATTHWALASRYRERWPAVDWQTDRFVTGSGRLYCAGGVYAALDLSLHLVERFAGYEVAMQTARALLVETRRTAQAGFAVPAQRQDHGDAEIAAAQDWMRQHLKEALRVPALARRFGMSPRSFARRFQQAVGEPPLAHLHGLRIEAAKHLLESPTRPLSEVAAAVGYEDAAFFRELFKRRTGAPPAAWRRRFARPASQRRG